ncbi:MAG: antirestriction protein ArdA, partial [Oscillospiraceae bacterium]|nr:antirestriction protein ArdA [Oscillospiraceae bacterium]
NHVAEWVQLPTDAENMKAAFARIGVDGIDPSEYEVAAYESPVDGLTDRFRPGESLDELNYLAALLAQRSQEEREKFAAAMIHGDHAASIADAINLTHNLDCYWLYPTVHNSEDYGHYVVDELDELELPEAAKKYFDYKAFGRDAVREDGGTFTDYGYIYNNKNDFAVWYTDHDIPKEHRITPDQPDTVFMDAAAIPQQAAAVTEPQQTIPIRPIELTATDTAGKVKEITAQLEAGVKDLFHSERYQDYLKAMSKFHDYSLNNTLLIVMQKPDASLVAGFNKWRDEFERHVKRGEKGIKILAPAPYKIKKEQEKLDPDGKPIIGEDGKPVTEQKEITIPAFKVVSVFDVSQTDGKEIPDIAVDSLTGNVEQYEDFFKALEQTSPVPVGFERIESGAHGYYHNAEKRIALNKGESELQTVKTLIHEIAHAKLHDIDLNAPPEQQQERPSRRTREVEAESIAYTVCQHFGLDTSDYSFGYVAGWSSDKDIKELKASLETIRATASELITEIDGHFRELQQQREAAQEERPVLESLDPEQQQAIRDEVQATLQMLVNADMQISGEVSQGTLDALTAQGYVLQDGVVQRMQQAELPMPDPTITVQEMNEYGYKWDGMLPLQEEAARRLFENEGVEIYRIYEDNTEGAVLNADEITEHAAQGGIFGVEKEAWQRHLEKPQQEQEAAEQTAPQPESTFAIYQLKDGEETRDYRFEPLDRLRAVGLDVQRDNYELAYSAPLADGESLEDIYRRFNIDHPADFTGHSLSVSDIVVLRNGDTETAHYCDSFGFTEVPEFLQQQEQTAEKWNGIDGLLNDKPFMPDATPTEQANALIDLAEQDGQRLGNAERGLIVQYHEQVQDLPKTIALVNELCEKGFEQQHGHLDYLVKQRIDAEITAAVQERQQTEPLPPSLDPAVQPVVTIIWSESDKLREGEQMPLARADALFKSLDETRRTEREQPGYDGSWYDKTKFRIDFTFHGEADNYEGRQDFGDGDGSLIDHIQAHHEYYSRDESYKNSVIRNEGAEAWAQEQAEREMILSEFVPYMRLHCNLYEQERTAADMLESGAELTPEQTAYFNAVLSHVDACREKLNAGDYDLPDPPQLADFSQEAAEMEAYKDHVREEIAQEAAAAGMTVEEYAANGYEPREQPIDAPE